MVRCAAEAPLPISAPPPPKDELQRQGAAAVAVVPAPPLFGWLPATVPGFLIVGLLFAEGMAILSSRDACMRFLKGVAASDVDEVSAVCGPLGQSKVESLHEDMFGAGEEVSLRALSTDYRPVLGLRARHVITVDEGSRGAHRLDETTTEIQVRLTSAGWRVERFSPLTAGRWEDDPPRF